MKRLIVIALVISMLSVVLTACSKELEFKTYTPDDKSFTIDFPGEPKVEETDLGVTKMKTYTVALKDSAYTTSVSVLPKETLDQFSVADILTNSINGAIANNKGQNAKIEDVTVSELAGKHATYTIDDNGKSVYAHVRVVVKDQTLYTLMVVVKNDDESTKKDVKKFFDSYKVNQVTAE